ncbi:glycosyltransferase family 9 protein [Nanoarchaeota archaeon]
MKSLTTIIKDKVKNTILFLDYLLWLLFDLSKFKKIKKERIKKVLIIHLGAIGELVTSSVLLPPLKENFNCEIDYMINPRKETVIENNPHISKILTYEKDFKENIKKLKEENFDLVIILAPGTTKMALICLLAGIKYRIGCFTGAQNIPAFFYTRRKFPFKRIHAVQENLEIIRTIGIDNKNPKLEFYISDKDKKSAEEKLKELSIKDYIIVHPTFSFMTEHEFPSRLWPSDRWAAVIDYLIETYKIKVLLTGSQKEKYYSEEIFGKLKNKEMAIVTSGMFNLGETAYLVSKTKLWIGTSTGITHITASFNTPIIELAGQNDPWQWHPWMSKNRYRIVRHLEKCSGCNLMYCRKKNLECMNAIKVEEIIDAIKELEGEVFE